MPTGQIVDATYKMNGPIVRRVLTPAELADQKAHHDAELAARQKARADAKANKPAKKSSVKRRSTTELVRFCLLTDYWLPATGNCYCATGLQCTPPARAPSHLYAQR